MIPGLYPEILIPVNSNQKKRGQALYEAKLLGNTATIKTHLIKELGRLRDVITGPDNMLYITTSNRDGRGIPGEGDDKIIRVNPAKL